MKLKRNTHKSRVLFVNQRISLSQHKGVNLSQRYSPLWFFVQMENRVVPLEIKSGTMASLKSLWKASHKVTIEIESRIADFTLINLPL